MTPHPETGALLSGLRTVADGPCRRLPTCPRLCTTRGGVALEQERAFGRDWVSPGLAAEIPEVGIIWSGRCRPAGVLRPRR
ncbi:MAG: hypothetical protein CM1200mP26_19220 [Acidimicrobiales bacterium]|nr:MAG: hypothetical protein CM1200mP26_19220 [Acidimicrobiales bacterium]